MTASSATQQAESDREESADRQRREFLTKALTAAGGAAAFLAAAPTATSMPRARVAGQLAENPLERMMAELEAALAKPVEQRKWMMVIDLQRCIGCRACTVSCEAENNLPPEVVYRPVLEEEIGTFPYVAKRFTPRPCMHCDNPPCLPVCPVDATHKRPDGVVNVEYDKCIGCGACVDACPYGARSQDFGDFHCDDTPEIMAYETRPNFEYGAQWKRTPGDYETPPMAKARKCHYCLHRIENGILPACVTTCLGGATLFGDYNLDGSLVRELAKSSRTMRLHEDWGTKPTTLYLV